jgi:hypothetical protein
MNSPYAIGKALKQLMPTSKKVKRYETEIKAFGKCLELKI